MLLIESYFKYGCSCLSLAFLDNPTLKGPQHVLRGCILIIPLSKQFPIFKKKQHLETMP